MSASECNFADKASREWRSQRVKSDPKAAGGSLQQGEGSKKANQRCRSPLQSGAVERRKRSRTHTPSPCRARGPPQDAGLRALVKSGAAKEKVSGPAKTVFQKASGNKGRSVRFWRQREGSNPERLRWQAGQVLGLRPVLRAFLRRSCDYAGFMCLSLSGESCSYGLKLQAALEHARPEAAWGGSLKLPRFRGALEGWRRLARPQTMLMEIIKSTISGESLPPKQLLRSTFQRADRLGNTEAQGGGLRQEELEGCLLPALSAAGVFDEVLISNDARAPWMDSVMNRHVQERFKEMWNFNEKQYLQVWRDAVNVLGVGDLGDLAKSPCQNRHGGGKGDKPVTPDRPGRPAGREQVQQPLAGCWREDPQILESFTEVVPANCRPV